MIASRACDPALERARAFTKRGAARLLNEFLHAARPRTGSMKDQDMRKIVASVAALAAALAFTVPAFAQEVMGVIKTYRPADRVIILEDGTQLYISEGVRVKQYEPGARVKFFIEDRGGRRFVTRVIETE
jgi:hypothetical protein